MADENSLSDESVSASGSDDESESLSPEPQPQHGSGYESGDDAGDSSEEAPISLPTTTVKKIPKKVAGSKENNALQANTINTEKVRPKTSDMINVALSQLKGRGGSSLQAIKKFIAETYKIDVERNASIIRKYLKNGVENGSIIQTKGIGATGSFKLAKVEKSKKPVKSVKPAAVGQKKKPSAKKEDNETKALVDKNKSPRTGGTTAKTSKPKIKVARESSPTTPPAAGSPKKPKPSKVQLSIASKAAKLTKTKPSKTTKADRIISPTIGSPTPKKNLKAAMTKAAKTTSAVVTLPKAKPPAQKTKPVKSPVAQKAKVSKSPAQKSKIKSPAQKATAKK